VTQEGGAVSEEARDSNPSNSSTDLCRVDSGVICNFNIISFIYLFF
jgi:hypothetical protein